MKARSVALQGALAVLGLAAAIYVWQIPRTETGVDEVVVLDLGRREVTGVTYEDPRRAVQVTREQGGRIWVRETTRPLAPDAGTAQDGGLTAAGSTDGGGMDAGLTVPDAGPSGGVVASPSVDAGPGGAVGLDGGELQGGPAEASPAPAVQTPRTREYRGNETAERVFDQVTPLRATRALGVLPPDRLEALGLTTSNRRLEISTRTGVHRLQVASAPLGVGAPYLRDVDDGKVYLLKGSLISDLEFAASRLVDRRLHGFTREDVGEVRVRVGERARTLTVQGERLLGEDGKPDELASNWHAKLWPQVAVEVLGRGEEPRQGPPEVAVRLEYAKGEQALGYTELGMSGPDVFARTEHTAGWVRLHGSIAQLVAEKDQLVPPPEQ